MNRFFLVIVRHKQGSEGLDGTSQDGHGPNSSLGQPRTNVFQFGWDEDQTRTRYIFKLRDKDRTGTKWGRGPNEDEAWARKGRDEDSWTLSEIKEPILGQGQDENGIKWPSLGALVITYKFERICPPMLKDKTNRLTGPVFTVAFLKLS